MFFSVSCHIPGHTVFVSHFPRFSFFSPKSRSYSVYFSYFTFFILSLHIPSHTVFASHFPRFSVFLPQSSSYSVYFSYLKFFTVSYLPYSMSYSVILISHAFQCFSPYFLYYYVSFSFSSFFSFLALFQVLQSVSVCLILHVFPFPSHNPGPRVYISHLLRFSVFVSIFQVIQYLCLIFQFLPFSR